jgi:hypothetical protein
MKAFSSGGKRLGTSCFLVRPGDPAAVGKKGEDPTGVDRSLCARYMASAIYFIFFWNVQGDTRLDLTQLPPPDHQTQPVPTTMTVAD